MRTTLYSACVVGLLLAGCIGCGHSQPEPDGAYLGCAGSLELYVMANGDDTIYLSKTIGGHPGGVAVVREWPDPPDRDEGTAEELRTLRNIVERMNERVLELEYAAGEAKPANTALIQQLQGQVEDLNERLKAIEDGPAPDDLPPDDPPSPPAIDPLLNLLPYLKHRKPSRLDAPAERASGEPRRY